MLQVEDNEFPLFKRRFIPGHDDLIFVGFAQAVPSIIKFVEIQTRWLAAYLAGDYCLARRARKCSGSWTGTNAGQRQFRLFQATHDASGHQPVCVGSGKRMEAWCSSCGASGRSRHARQLRPTGTRGSCHEHHRHRRGEWHRLPLVTVLAEAGHAVVATDVDERQLDASAVRCSVVAESCPRLPPRRY